MIIDFHTHIFPEKIAARTIAALSESSRIRPSTDGTAAALSGSMRRAGIGLSINLPVMTRPQQVDKVNDSLLKNRMSLEKAGIISFGGMHPDYADYKNKLKFLASEGVKGIKLHPAYQGTDLDDPKMLRIIDAASSCALIVVTHAGSDIGMPGHNFADISMILKVIEEVRPDRFVLAHMGGWQDWENVKRYIAGADVWLDTAFSIGKIDLKDSAPSGRPDTDARTALQAPGSLSHDGCNMTPGEFVALCRAHGTDRILFGTDCPWAGQKTYVDAVCSMPFGEDEKKAILGGNASGLLSGGRT